MLDFLKAFVAWLASQNIIPPEKSESDLTGEDKTYLMNFPDDRDGINNCFVIKQYNQMGNILANQDTKIRYVQILVRNISHMQTIISADKVFNFLSKRPEAFEELPYIEEEVAKNAYMLICAERGSIKLEEDAQGRFRYSISFSITTNL